MENRNNQPDQQASRSSLATSNENNQAQQNVNDSNNPADRMQDGTNDFKNGDQEPTSEASSSQ